VGFLPLAEDPAFRHLLHGQVPFWDVPAAKARVVLSSTDVDHPFHAGDGKVRIFAHYADAARIAELQRKYGAPAGHVDAELQSSKRTLLLFPEDGVPFFLKFDGRWAAPSGAGDDPRMAKPLRAEHLERAAARTRQTQGNPFFTPEPAGLIAGDHCVLYRELPLSSLSARGGQRLLPLTALLSGPFAATGEGKRIFGADPDAWFARELAPHLAKISQALVGAEKVLAKAQ
jgi:hypothetical protein